MRKSQNLLDIHEVCDYFGLSESTVRRKVRDSKDGKGCFPLPLFKTGCRVLWRKCDIEAWRGDDAEVVTLTMSPTAYVPPVQPESLTETRKRLAELGITVTEPGNESNN